MSRRVPTFSNSPYVGTFQYQNAGPNHIHINPNSFLLPANMPFIGTFRHNIPYIPLFLPSFLKTTRDTTHDTSTTHDISTQTEELTEEPTSKNKRTQTSPLNLDTFVIVKYQPDDSTDI